MKDIYSITLPINQGDTEQPGTHIRPLANCARFLKTGQMMYRGPDPKLKSNLADDEEGRSRAELVSNDGAEVTRIDTVRELRARCFSLTLLEGSYGSHGNTSRGCLLQPH